MAGVSGAPSQISRRDAIERVAAINMTRAAATATAVIADSFDTLSRQDWCPSSVDGSRVVVAVTSELDMVSRSTTMVIDQMTAIPAEKYPISPNVFIRGERNRIAKAAAARFSMIAKHAHANARGMSRMSTRGANAPANNVSGSAVPRWRMPSMAGEYRA